ncbi:hypothetical protein ACQEVF_57895 [Nonomuraea polychroma]|uniref:hypothetical protein n=1 Tax=Nonomuraea polychroma TaxID=46176 RepID=UPI003D90126B
MGACLHPTPEMGPFSVEARRESFYLNAASAVLLITAKGEEPRCQWRIADTHAAALVAALDQVMAHPSFAEHDHDPEDGHQVRRRDGWLDVDGVGYPYQDPEYAAVELEYRHVRALRAALLNVSDSEPKWLHWIDDPLVDRARHRLQAHRLQATTGQLATDEQGSSYLPTSGTCGCGDKWAGKGWDPVAYGYAQHMLGVQRQAHDELAPA